LCPPEVFAAIAHSGSMRAGAGRVARSQSAASAALAELETAHGEPLFDRVGRGLVLDENGRALLPGAVALLDQAAELQGLSSGEHAAPLRVAASLTIGEYLLPGLMAQWKLAHPLAAAQAGARAAGLAAPTRISDCQLAEASWILREHGSGTRQASDRWLIEHLGSLNIGFELGSTEAIKRLAAAGAGLACLSRHTVAEELASGELVALRTRLPVARRRLALVVRKDKHLGRATEDFIGHCVAMAPAGQ